MICFIVTPEYRHHFRPSRQRDEMPIRPLIDVLLYWFCSVFGGLFGAIAAMSLVVRAVENVAFDRIEMLTVGAMAVVAPLLFVVAYRSWRKLNRPHEVAYATAPAERKAKTSQV